MTRQNGSVGGKDPALPGCSLRRGADNRGFGPSESLCEASSKGMAGGKEHFQFVLVLHSCPSQSLAAL